MGEVIFSADDFGLTPSVNEAVELAHIKGRLARASLMVAAPAAADAVIRAHRLPGLEAGLHLVLVDGDSLLGHAKLAHITGPDGRFSRNQLALAFRYFLSPRARREAAAEIRAQFAAFAATGLNLHHADAHKHMHLHPTIGAMMIRIGKEFGLTRIRVPAEPPATLRACGEKPGLADRMLHAWTRVLRRQARRAGLATTDHVFGVKWSGHMRAERVRRLLRNLPSGSSEIYFHPATYRDDILKTLMPDYEHGAELQALLDSDAIADRPASGSKPIISRKPASPRHLFSDDHVRGFYNCRHFIAGFKCQIIDSFIGNGCRNDIAADIDAHMRRGLSFDNADNQPLQLIPRAEFHAPEVKQIPPKAPGGDRRNDCFGR